MSSDQEQPVPAPGDLPQIEVEIIDSLEDPRRHCGRTPGRWPLQYVDDAGICHPLDLKILRDVDAGSLQAHSAQLIDVSADGLSIASAGGLSRGEAVRVVGIRLSDGSLLFDEAYLVCNLRRRRTAPASRDDVGERRKGYVSFGAAGAFVEVAQDNPEFIYGLSCLLEGRPGSRLYQVVLQSVFLHYIAHHCPHLGQRPPWWRG